MSEPSYMSGLEGHDILAVLENGMPFSGPLSFMRQPQTRELGGVDLTVIGVPFDLGATNRVGTRYGPRVVREQSVYVSAFPPLYPWGYDLASEFTVTDFGDVVAIPSAGALEFMMEATQAVVSKVLDAGVNPLCIGGDHTLPYGPIRAAAARYGPLALVHVDAHQDTHDADDVPELPILNHGTFAAGLVKEGCIDVHASSQVYIRTHMPQPKLGDYEITYADDALAMGPEALAEKVRARAAGRPVYLTFDIDAIDPAYAPGTGSPVPVGATSGDARRFLKALSGIDVVAADLVEVNPLYDSGQITAVLGATLAMDLLYLLGDARRQRRAP